MTVGPVLGKLSVVVVILGYLKVVAWRVLDVPLELLNLEFLLIVAHVVRPVATVVVSHGHQSARPAGGYSTRLPALRRAQAFTSETENVGE